MNCERVEWAGLGVLEVTMGMDFSVLIINFRTISLEEHLSRSSLRIFCSIYKLNVLSINILAKYFDIYYFILRVVGKSMEIPFLVGLIKFLASSHSVGKSYPKLDSDGCVILEGMTTSSHGKSSWCGDEYIAREGVVILS